MAIWEKLFSKITFKNYPDTSTPVNADNLNKMTDAIDGIDDRVVELNSNLQIETNYYFMGDGSQIVATEYVEHYILSTHKMGNLMFCNGSILFTKSGINVDLLTNLPFEIAYVARMPLSTWITAGQAFMYANQNSRTLGGSFSGVTPDTEYTFNFMCVVK